jgi:Bifunctional DNA primase/polymerase, N-terminal
MAEPAVFRGDRIMNVVAQALALAAHGYPVFPVAASKRPTCPHGFQDAATEATAIRRLWRDYPGPLIGVPTGKVTDLFVLDIDSPRHTEAAEWLERCAPYLPETRQQTTRSGGVHLFFNHHPGLRNSAGRVAVGVDVRASGGYIIVWSPAVWLIEPQPLADLPAWLIKAATPPPAPVVRQSKIALSADSARRKVEGIVGAVAAAQAGQRNALAFWGACRLAELAKQRILAERDAIALGIEAARQAGLSPKEAQRTIASAFRGQQ